MENLIKGGFSFCGTDIADLGLYYAPENENTYVYRPAEVNIHEETFDGHDGGYFYGVSRQPKEFTLRCYFENKIIDRGIMEKIYHLFRTGKSGKLVFSRRPWCYYYATVTSLPHPELSNYLNGVITVTMKAHYPYARSDDLYYLSTYDKYDWAMQSTAMLHKQAMVPATSYTSSFSGTKNFILYNAGTEYSPLSIAIAGNAGTNGIIITNNTTGQQCKIVAMRSADTTNVNKFVYVDGINGKTMLVNRSTFESTPAFYFHDSGFIDLKPAYPVMRDIFLKYVEGTTAKIINILDEDVTGKYIFVKNKWCKILSQDEDTLELDQTITGFTSEKTIIAEMNEIEVRPLNSTIISYLKFDYKATYA